MGILTPRAQQVLDLLAELSCEEDITFSKILFELLYAIDFDNAIREALEQRGYEVRLIMEIPN